MDLSKNLKKQLVFWGEKYLFSPGPFEKLLSILFLPLSALYCLIVWYKYKSSNQKDFGLPVISVGNLIVGGSGKTPLTVALAKKYDKAAIILRGYGRESKGLYIVSDAKSILCDVKISGDEAMLYASLLPNAMVIVAEDRQEGISKAKEMGAKVVFLDDAYSKHFIKKLDLLILSPQKNNFCLPSGPFRERLWKGKEVISLEENMDFKRCVSISNEKNKMVLVTAISKPHRLDPYVEGRVINKIYFPDHYSFTKKELEEILLNSKADSLLVTHKDAVKMKKFDLEISFLDLELNVNMDIHNKVQEYVRISQSK